MFFEGSDFTSIVVLCIVEYIYIYIYVLEESLHEFVGRQVVIAEDGYEEASDGDGWSQ